MKKKDQNHDLFFKDLMHDIEAAKEFLLNYIDEEVKTLIDWDTLAPYDSSLIGNNNKQRYADVLYVAKTKAHKTDVFLILNHERKADRLLPIRLQEYVLGVLKKNIKQKKNPEFILHLTWHNGKKGPYPYEKSIFDYFQEKEVAKKMFLQPCTIINPHDLSDHEMADHVHTNVMELFMKYGDDPDLLLWLEANPEIVKKLAENKYIDRAIEYVADVGYHKVEDLLATFEKVSEKLKKTMLTTAQQLQQQGRQVKALDIAKNMLFQLHLGMDVVQKATGLTGKELKNLKE